MRTTMSRRNRMVSFRLSDEEYVAYRDACSRAGIRSISEMARAGLQHLFSVPSGNGLDHKLSDLRDRIQFLSFELDRITEQVRRRDVG
jgi:hypothetical protein